MKLFKFYLLLPVVAALLVFTSCKENSTNTPTPKNYYPMTSGSYWVYDSFDTDSLGNVDFSNKTTDSTYVSGTATKLGRLASIFTTITDGDQSSKQDNFFYKDGSKLYTFSNFLTPNDTSFNIFQISDRWVLIADDNSSQWTIFDTTLANMPIDFQGQTVPLNGKLTFTGKKGSLTSVTWGPNRDKTIQAQEFITEIKFTGTITYLVQIGITMSSTIHTYYAENVGPVKSRMEPFVVDVSGLYTESIPGYETFLVRYNVK